MSSLFFLNRSSYSLLRVVQKISMVGKYIPGLYLKMPITILNFSTICTFLIYNRGEHVLKIILYIGARMCAPTHTILLLLLLQSVANAIDI